MVGVRADADDSLRHLRTLLAAWVDDAQRDIPWAFDLVLDPQHSARDRARRGVRPVPQLRAGQLLMARSRSTDDVLRALAHVLGGVLANQDLSRSWSGLRPFVAGDRVVLVDARPPALTADAELARAGVDEVPSWSVAVDGATVEIPPPLHDLDWEALGLDAPPATSRSVELCGLVALDRHAGCDDEPDPGSTRAGAFSRFAVRHATTTWFSTVGTLAHDQRVAVEVDRPAARRRIIDLLAR
jgi:hypothetical protein